jgi:hypothetical protein
MRSTCSFRASFSRASAPRCRSHPRARSARSAAARRRPL